MWLARWRSFPAHICVSAVVAALSLFAFKSAEAMAVAYKSAGSGAATETSGAALSPACPATVDNGDVLIAHVYFEGTATTPSTPSGWTLLDGPRLVEATIGRKWVFGRVADGSEDGAAVAFGTPAVTTMRSARVYSFSGRVSGGIAEIVTGFSYLSHATDPQMPTVRTTVAGALAVALVCQNDNNALASATGESGGDWTEAVADFVSALTPGLVLQIQTATPTSDPGTISGGAVAATNDPSGVIAFQIRPTATHSSLLITQSNHNRSAGDVASHNIAASFNPVVGEMIAVKATLYSDLTPTAAMISNSGGATLSAWSRVEASLQDTGDIRQAMFVATVTATGPCTVTITPTSNKTIAAALWVVGGPGTLAALTGNKGRGTNSSPAITGDLVTSVDSVIVGGVSHNWTTVTLTIGTNYTPDGEDESDSALPYNVGHRTDVPETAGTYTMDWTVAADSNRTWSCTAIAIGIAGGGAFTLTAELGTFALTGQAAGLTAQRKLVAAQGSFALTGNAAALNHGFRMQAALGTYALSGQAAALNHGYRMAAAVGVFTLTGNAANLRAAKVMPTTHGVFVLTGFDIAFTVGKSLLAQTGVFTLTGNDAALLAARIMAAAQGSFSLTGFAAILNKSRVMAADLGVYTLTGNAAGFIAAHRLTAALGTFTLTGNTAALFKGVTMPAALGTLVLTGNAAALRKASRLNAQLGVFALTGQAAGLLAARRMLASPGVFALTGFDAAMRRQYRLIAGVGLFELIGRPATLTSDAFVAPVAPQGQYAEKQAETYFKLLAVDDFAAKQAETYEKLLNA